MINRYASLKQGLVGCWIPSLGASGFRLIDRSGNNNHGTLTNMDPGTDWVPSGGKLALDFDGSNDKVLTQGQPSISLGLTISLWAKLGNTNFPHFFVKPSSSAWSSPFADYALRIEGTGGKIQACINNFGVASNIIDGSTTITVDGLWHHFAFTYDLATMRLFLDAKIDGTKALVVSSINNSAFNPIIGDNTNATGLLLGQLDDVRLYNRALTPSEIRLLYTGGRGVGLVPERIKHRRRTTAAATNRRRRIICGANC